MNQNRKQKRQRSKPAPESESVSPGDLHEILQDLDPTWNGKKPEAGPPIRLTLPPGPNSASEFIESETM